MSWEGESWKEAARKNRAEREVAPRKEHPGMEQLRRLLDPNVSIERAWTEIYRHRQTGRVAASSVEALTLELRERGEAALAKPESRRRLAALSTTQVREVIARLIALRPRHPAITDDLLFRLGEQLR
jgi:hypothetical protein